MPSKNAQTATPASNTPSSAKQLPVQTFRLGRIKAAVWENEADRKKFFNVTFARVYTGEDKQPHDTRMGNRTPDSAREVRRGGTRYL